MSEKAPTPALNAAIVKLQGMLPRVVKGESANITRKDGTPGPKYKYADLADVSEAILSLLSQCGLAFTAKGGFEGGVFGLVTTLIHESGEEDPGFWPLPDPRQTPPQQVGSAITYYRRYGLCAATGVAPDGDDDDAGAAQGGFRPSAGDMFDSASPQRDRDGGRQWQPRQPAANGHAPEASARPGAAPDGEGAFVAKFHEDLKAAKGESAVRVLQTDVGKAIRSGTITAPTGNDLLAAARERMTEVRSAA